MARWSLSPGHHAEKVKQDKHRLRVQLGLTSPAQPGSAALAPVHRVTVFPPSSALTTRRPAQDRGLVSAGPHWPPVASRFLREMDCPGTVWHCRPCRHPSRGFHGPQSACAGGAGAVGRLLGDARVPGGGSAPAEPHRPRPPWGHGSAQRARELGGWGGRGKSL